MESLCYQKLNSIENGINEEFNSYSYALLDQLKLSGELDRLLSTNDIYNCLKYELIIFLNILNNPVNDDKPYLRRIFLHESDLAKTFKKFGYILSLYVNDIEVYRVFPLFVKKAMEKYEMLGSEEVVEKIRKYMDLKCGYDYNYQRILEELPVRYPNMYKDYEPFVNKLQNKIFDPNDKDELAIASEYFTYISEYENLKKHKEYIADVIVKWVSKDHGDGYGYDVLSYDPETKRQKLIEVKSGASNFFALTSNELKKVYEATTLGCDYYIYRCFYNKELNEIMLTRLIFDPENNYFYNIMDSNDIYYLDIYFDVDENGKEVVVRRVNNDESFALKYKESKN